MKSPFPGDRRFSKPSINPSAFDLPNINIEFDSRNKRTLAMTKMEKQTKRGDVFKLKRDIPDGNNYQT